MAAKTCNVGRIDRVIRAVIGIALIGAGGWAWDGWQGAPGGIVAVIAGAVLLGTALTAFCPLYRVLGVRTCPEEG